MNAHYLAFDLGAESGRAIQARLRSGILEIKETYRFPNEPVHVRDSLRWDILRLWWEMQRVLDDTSLPKLDSVGVDTWGVDYALLGERGNLVENPYHYRDRRTEGAMEAVFERVSREEIYDLTGIQFLPFNTLYQFFVACRATPQLLEAAQSLVTIPDLLNYWLTGHITCEYTNATTTQFVDPRTRSWASELLARLGLPTRLLPPIVEPGTIIGGLTNAASGMLAAVPVVAPACHDTGSAVASVATWPRSAFLSSGTWSLLGAEITTPVVTPRACDLNFTNEGGVCGTVRLLKNIAGLWLLQSCRKTWAANGEDLAYDGLLAAAAADGRNSFRSLFDPDHPTFLHPDDMPSAIADYCTQTEQPTPTDAPAFTRAILESLALKYREVLESLEELTGNRFDQIRVFGGGSKNCLLNQFTANATGRTVVAGPAEATALGNIAMQMLATGAVTSIGEARAIIDRSFPVERFEPRDTDRWNSEYRRFQHYLEHVHA
jgi:rhamnulokinase